MIPLPQTTIEIERLADPDADQFDTAAWTPVATGVRAVIGEPAGLENRDGGARSDRTARLNADPCELLPRDRVVDLTTGETWSVDWVNQRGPLLAHTVAGLTNASGVARG